MRGKNDGMMGKSPSPTPDGIIGMFRFENFIQPTQGRQDIKHHKLTALACGYIDS